MVRNLDLAGRRAIVTGATSGIGLETARALAGAGAEVTLAARDTGTAERVSEELIAGGADAVRVARVDLADLGSVAAFVHGWAGPLHILVGNAGVAFLPDRRLTAAGVEMHFAVNHLGHFALALGLHDALAAEGGRIVSVSSRAHLRAPVVFNDISFDRRPYDPLLAYGQSKTANILFAVEATRRWGAHGILANAVMPGTVLTTKLTRHMDESAVADALASGTHRVKTAEQGAAASVFAATWPALEGIGGRCFWDCNEVPPAERGTTAATAMVAGYAVDPAAAGLLWERSVQMLNDVL